MAVDNKETKSVVQALLQSFLVHHVTPSGSGKQTLAGGQASMCAASSTQISTPETKNTDTTTIITVISFKNKDKIIRLIIIFSKYK